ncbi:hypothetical protein, partial [Muriicola sp.]|uniref:hypothetical protein n=1 Tax=Muriicola sp. TaxID=2020856 RepID=UPI0035635633
EQTEEKGAISRTKVTVFQEHRSEVLNVDLDISYDAILNTNFIDSSGRTVLTPGSRKVNKGKNLLEYDMRMVPSQVLIMNVYTGREIISKKILYRK